MQRTHGGVNFWGQADIKNSVVVGGDLTLKLGTDYQDYLDQVANVFSTWRNQYILGPASAKESPFVPTGAAALIQRRISALRRGQNAVQLQPINLAGLLVDRPRVLLLGKPGSGKTSYLQYLALERTLPDSSLKVLPVLIELGYYDGTQPFFDFVRNFLSNPPQPQPPELPIHVANPWLADNLRRIPAKRAHIVAVGRAQRDAPRHLWRERPEHQWLARFSCQVPASSRGIDLPYARLPGRNGE